MEHEVHYRVHYSQINSVHNFARYKASGELRLFRHIVNSSNFTQSQPKA